MARVVAILLLFMALAGSLGAAEPVALRIEGGELQGTLELPDGVSFPMPVALIIAGVGPTDRDGNNPLTGKNDSLKLLAQGLAARGIASLRFDKRGVAASASAGCQEADLRFDTLIADAANWGRKLEQDPRFADLFIIGHSEGALIGAVAAQRLSARGYASLAGAGRPAYAVLADQLQKNLPPTLFFESMRIISLLKTGQITEQVSPPLMFLFRPSVQPYLISWFAYDPTREIAKIKAPCLIIQGDTDLHVGLADAQRLAQANPRARLLIIKGMNHILKQAPPDPALQMKSYGDPSLPVSPELVNNVAVFIKGKSTGK